MPQTQRPWTGQAGLAGKELAASWPSPWKGSGLDSEWAALGRLTSLVERARCWVWSQGRRLDLLLAWTQDLREGGDLEVDGLSN